MSPLCIWCPLYSTTPNRAKTTGLQIRKDIINMNILYTLVLVASLVLFNNRTMSTKVSFSHCLTLHSSFKHYIHTTITNIHSYLTFSHTYRFTLSCNLTQQGMQAHAHIEFHCHSQIKLFLVQNIKLCNTIFKLYDNSNKIINSRKLC